MKYLTTILLTALITIPAPAADWSGYLSLESRAFASEAQFRNQSDRSLSLAFEPEFFHEWDDGSQQFVFTPFVRIDSEDDERTHLEIRELYWL